MRKDGLLGQFKARLLTIHSAVFTDREAHLEWLCSAPLEEIGEWCKRSWQPKK